MAFGKLVSLKLHSQYVQQSLTLDNLSIGFRVRRSNKFTANTAEFKIRNLADQTVTDFLRPNVTVEFKAGWEDQDQGQLSTIFIGNVLRETEMSTSATDITYSISAASIANFAKIRSEELQKIASEQAQLVPSGEGSTEIRRAIKAAANARAAALLNSDIHPNKVFVAVTYKPGTRLLEVMEDIYTGILGLSLDGTELVRNIILPNGFLFRGRARTAMYKINGILTANGLTAFVDHTNCFIYSHTQNNTKSQTNVGYLSWGSGLVKLGRMVDYVSDNRNTELFPPKQMLKCTALLNPKFAPNSVVHIDTPQIQGYYLIEEVEFYGDNQEGEFLADLTLSVHQSNELKWDAVASSTETGIA